MTVTRPRYTGACAMPDIMDVILSLSGIQSDLRLLQAEPTRFPPNGRYEVIVHLTAALQAHVRRWITDTEPRVGQTERRHRERRSASAPPSG